MIAFGHGRRVNAYVGMFDGNGYEIKEIRLVDVQAQSLTNRGLFGWIGTGGKVQDLAVSVKYVGNSSLSVSDSGLLSVNNAGTIERCSATISNALYTDSFGMIAYENRGQITDCLSYVSATGNKLSISGKAAGIARTNTGTISNCFFRGSFRTGKTDYAIAENSGGNITGMRTTVVTEKFTLMGTRALAILWYGRARVNATVARWLGC